MQFSHSRLSSHQSCKFKYKMHYLDQIKTIPDDKPDNALYLGSAIHEGIEKGVEAGIKLYYDSYTIIDDNHINEAIKLEYLIPKVRELLPDGEYELKIDDPDYVGYMDLLAPVTDWDAATVDEGITLYDLYDFKYSNNISNYMDSEQLHLYKYYYEKQNPGKIIRNMYFVFIPKVKIKQKKTEDLYTFRKRIMTELQQSEVKIKEVQYDVEKVIGFLTGIKSALETTDFDQNKTYLCNWCEYQNYCEKGIDYMLLPSTERRNIEKIAKKVIWLYGAPFSGKTFLANKFPDPLMLNTDGNIKFVDAPFIAIKDNIVVEGRMTKKTLAWAVFKEAIAELEKKQNNFKTLVVDLLEDTYEHCRLFMYDQMGITHESDDSFRAWDKVRTEFLSTLKRLMNLDYENIILISHEDTSKDVTKKGGDKITAIKPNLQEKASNKVAGMVDIVARVIADDNVRTLNFKTNEVIFGGGRLNVTANTIPLDYNELMKVYEEANQVAAETKTRTSRTAPAAEVVSATEVPQAEPDKNFTSEVQKAEPSDIKTEPARTRRSRSETPVEEVKAEVVPAPENVPLDVNKPAQDLEPATAAPERKTRKKRGE